jgi:thiaminase
LLKMNLLELVAIEDKLHSKFAKERFVEKVSIKTVEDKKLPSYLRRCYIHLKINEWNEKVEEKVCQIFQKFFKVDINFWTNHRLLEQAQKTMKRSNNVALMVQHPNQKGKGSYLTTYIILPK